MANSLDKIIPFNADKNLIKRLADKRADNGDYIGALDFLLPYLQKESDAEFLLSVADVYREMERFELSNLYLFKYMSKVKTKDVSIAYEGLATNYFYLNEFDLTGYYLKKRLDTDGFLDRDNIDPEILDFYTEEDEESNIRLIYPYNLADYTKELNEGKRQIARGNYEEGLKTLLSIPKECPAYKDAVESIAICYLINQDAKTAISYVREMINLNGESVLAYCHLSSMYSAIKDFDKSDYYYAKAKSMESISDEDAYRLAFCAFEKNDDEFASSCMEKILIDREYDVDMMLFYALSLMNANRLFKAKEVLSKAYRINPQNFIVDYYLNFIKRVLNFDNEAIKMLPLKYNLDLPEKAYEEYVGKILELSAQNQKAFNQSIKNSEVKKMLKFGAMSKNTNFSEACILTLIKSVTPFSIGVLKECLILEHIGATLKRIIVHTLVYHGEKEFNLTVEGRFNKFKLSVVMMKDKEDDLLFYAGYVSAVSLLSITPFSDYKSLAFKANKVYMALKESKEFLPDEIGALMVYLLDFKPINTPKKVCQYFQIKKEKFMEILSAYKGEKSDKNY